MSPMLQLTLFVLGIGLIIALFRLARWFFARLSALMIPALALFFAGLVLYQFHVNLTVFSIVPQVLRLASHLAAVP